MAGKMVRTAVLACATFAALTLNTAVAQLMTKPQVANLIVKVENGVDEFRDYLERRGDNTRDRAEAAPAEGRRGRRGTATESQKAAASEKKDDPLAASCEIHAIARTVVNPKF